MVLDESSEESDVPLVKKTKRKPDDGDDSDSEDGPPKKKQKKVRIAVKPTRVEPAAAVVRRTEPPARVTRSSAHSSKPALASDDDLNLFDALPISALLQHSSNPLTPIPESQPAEQTTTPPHSPRSSFFQPSPTEAPLWNLLQNQPSRSEEPTSLLTIPYDPLLSEPIIHDQPEPNQTEPQPRTSDHSAPRAS
ncbi:hypothetical protein, partial [Bradyrhizobium sp. TM233]|uniref:hypothetical protein n=1 Tax=Bradyrhizobium sp. TM233 TaxID=2599801 RepID=UPI0030C6F27C